MAGRKKIGTGQAQRFGVKVEAELRSAIEREAKRRGEGISDVIRSMLRDQVACLPQANAGVTAR